MSSSGSSWDSKQAKAGTTSDNVTEKAGGESLGDHEQRYKLLVDSLNSIIMTVDNQLRITYMNKYGLKFFGYSPEEILGKNVMGITIPFRDDKGTDLEQMAQDILNNPQKHKTNVHKNMRKDGQLVWVSWTNSPRYDRNGNLVEIIAVGNDISELKDAEEAIKENERLYKAVFDNSQDGFLMAEILYDEEGKPCDNLVLKVNSAFSKQEGIMGKDLVGRKLRELNRSIDQSWLDIQNTVLRTGKSINFENYSKNTERYYDVYMFPITRTIFGQLFRDITEKKKAQEEIECSSRRINEVLESISDDFMVLDCNWNYVYANRQAAKLVGLEPKDIVGKNFWELFPQNKGTYIEQNLREAMENREIRRFELFGQYSKVHKLITTYPSVEGIVLIATDITERKSLEDQLHEKERLAAIGATAGMVGHDIRNPLQAMMSDVYLLKDLLTTMPPMKTKEEAAESLDGLEKNIGYVNKIVADLQDYARPLKPEYSCVYLPDVIASIFKTVTLPDNIQLLINVKVPDKIETEATFIRRSLTNLVNNAIQAMPDGGNLTISASEAENKLLITVEDTGVGIPEDVKPKLFSPMTTTKAKGQGLGLAVVKRLVEALNGNVSFESQEGKGTKFAIELPLTRPKASTNF